LEKQVEVCSQLHDIHVARLLVAGCDVWLNTARSQEAHLAGVGWKAAMNGCWLSVLDGWWDGEADYVHRLGDRTGVKVMMIRLTRMRWRRMPCMTCSIRKWCLCLPPGCRRAAASVDYQNEGGDPVHPFFNTARRCEIMRLQSLFPASDRYHSSV